MNKWGTEAGDQRGVNGSRSKFLRNSNRRPISQNRPSPQAFWSKFGIAMKKLNQHKRPRTSERNHEANRKRIGKTAELICLDRSDRWHPENPRKLRFKRWISTKRPRKSMKLGELLRPYPVNISPKDLVPKINESWELWGRSKGLGFSQELKKSNSNMPVIPEGLGQG